MRRSHARSRLNKNNNTAMDPVKLHIRPNPRSISKFKQSKSTVVLPLFFTLIALLSFYYLFRTNHSLPSRKKYGIIIDGGSTGTRIHVFRYRIEGGKSVFDFGEEGALKVNPGLSAYAEDPDGAGGSLLELLQFAKGKVPRQLWGETEIRLMATAGLRLLDSIVQERILEASRMVLRKSGFKFRDGWASVITGSDEGLYAWVVANYALGSLGRDTRQTTGIIELGGASAQITFVSNEPVPSEFLRTVKFGNITYSIYSHSFLHFGQNSAFEALRELLVSGDFRLRVESLEKGIFMDPCAPKGYSHVGASSKPSSGLLTGKDISTLLSRGNFSECRSAALMLLQKGKEKCSYKQCNIGSIFIPKLWGKFLATENFFYTSKFFGLGQKAFLSNLMMAGQHFCGEDWSRLRMKHQSLDDEDLMHYCFSSAYIVALLHDSLGIALDDERIRFANQVRSIPLDWALGAFILQCSAAPDLQYHNWIVSINGDDSHTLFSLIAIALLLMFIVWTILKWRKPQLKTVYDLEKGRYIVTRVGKSRQNCWRSMQVPGSADQKEAPI